MTSISETPAIHESHTEPSARLADHINVTDGVLACRQEDPRRAVYAVRNGAGGWMDVSITDFLHSVRGMAKGLIGLGVSPGDAVAVMSSTKYSWAVTDQAVWFAGGVSVPIYETSSTHQIAHILADSGAKIVLIGDEQLRERVTTATRAVGGKESGIEVFSIAGEAQLEDIAACGEEVSDQQLERARTSADAEDVATLVYTSGTTGTPKAVRITHRNLAEGAANIVPFAADILGHGESRTLLFLPLAHVLARAVQLICLHRGIQVAHTPDPSTLLEDLRSYRPTWLLAVPRVLEKVYHSAAAKAQNEGKGKIFEAARATAVAYSEAVQAAADGNGKGPSVLLRSRHAVFSVLVYSKLRAALGGEVTHMVSGASALNPEIGHFFTGIGVPVQEGYGLTESTAPITLNIPGATRIGTVGLPVPGSTVRIAEDGEVLLKGPVVFDGYHQNKEETAQAFDGEGFFRTGDLGHLDADGFLTITGRKKDIIVTAGGKNISPALLEEAVRAHPLVAQAVVVGENRPYVGALVSLDPEAVSHWGAQRGDGELSLPEALDNETTVEALRAEVQAAVDRANEQVSRAESIRRFELLHAELTEAGGHLTPSMKLRRAAVVEDFSDVVERLYSR